MRKRGETIAAAFALSLKDTALATTTTSTLQRRSPVIIATTAGSK